MNRRAFTLLELLIALTIIGVLAGIFGVSFIRSIRTAELRDAANQVVTDLRRARSQAQRGSTDVVLVLPGTSGGTTYKVDTVNKTLPSNVKVICKTNCGSGATTNITYQAPYGELGGGATGSVYTVRSPISGINDFEIRIVGVTGKVILTRAGS